MQKRGILLAVLVVLVMFGLIGAYVFFSYGQLRPEDGKICEGIKVGEIDIGGMTAEEAARAVESYTSGKAGQVIEVGVN